MMMYLYFIALVLSIGTVLIANYTDLRERIIPNKLTYPMIVAGIALHLSFGALQRDLIVAVRGGLGAGLAFGIGYGMYLTGGWAGGDVKLFTALGALLPVYSPPFDLPYSTAFPPYASFYPLFPVTLLFNSVIIVLPVFLVFALISKIRGEGIFYNIVKISDLEEGMIPAEIIYEKDGEFERYEAGYLGFISRKVKTPDWDRRLTDPDKAAGVTQEQVDVLKKLVEEEKLEDEIKIKRGTPFAPAFGAGLFIGLFYGGLYWKLILLLI
ncbi:hypothetical protein AKJ62_02260 [candidate division MSBL1 archaeon SCGC-AAA259D14]|uniref:Prepilin type IV endopeptidase peptidase domain-containing protein n=1 Tax=candidate division MSBL1 archaeon SCGC-AAA259D14 TaxID=1698261 RepID=A0A133U6M7_9EURY|nr:hypothetical protein AKJ62_02260 [candidate division MSBL1 archaeon SCGC-AAA259D14]